MATIIGNVDKCKILGPLLVFTWCVKVDGASFISGLMHVLYITLRAIGCYEALMKLISWNL